MRYLSVADTNPKSKVAIRDDYPSRNQSEIRRRLGAGLFQEEVRRQTRRQEALAQEVREEGEKIAN